MIEEITEAMEKEQEALQKLEALSALNDQITQLWQQGMSLPQAMAYRFDIGKGPGFASLPTVMAMYGEQISANIPEEAGWSNITEGLMDVAGMGGIDLSNMYGKNVHEALKNSEGFQRWAAEMGVTADELLKGVPKFAYAEQYLPTAIAGLTQAVTKIPKEMYDKMDHLGADIGKIGIEWNELAQYAVGKSMAGQDWNLVDYIAESWGMSIEEATNYLLSHGIDPTVLNNALFPDLDLEVASQGGKMNVFDEKWYDWFTKVTKDGTDKVIEVTKDQWARIPDAVKLSMSNMGYSFVIGGQQTAQDARTSYETIRKSIEDTYGGGLGDDLGRWTDELGNEWVKTTDALGKPIDVPAPTYDAYKTAVEEIKRLNKELRGITADNHASYKDYLADFRSDQSNYGQNPLSESEFNAGSSKTTVIDLGLPPLTDYSTYGDQAHTAFVSGFFNGAETPAGGTGQLELIKPEDILNLDTFTDLGQKARTHFMDGFSGMGTSASSASGGMDSSIGGGAKSGPGDGSGPFDSIFEGYATSAVEKFRTKVNDLMPQAVGMLSMYGIQGEKGEFKAGGGGGPFDSIFEGYAKSAVEKFRSTINDELPTALEGIGAGDSAGGVATGAGIPMPGAGGPFEAMGQTWGQQVAAGLSQSLSETLGADALKPTLTLNADDFFAMAASALEIGRVLGSTTSTATLTLDATAFFTMAASAFETMRAMGETTATPKAVLEATSFWTMAASIFSTLSGLSATTASPSVTLDAGGFWAMAGLIHNEMQVLDGLSATASVTTTYTNVVQTVNSGGVVGRAKGGYVNERLTLVGENGPELVSFGQGAFVHTASETSQMLRGLSTTRQSGGGSGGNGDQIVVQFNGDNHFYNETDVDMLVDRIQYLIGKENRKAQRGMIPVDISALHNPN
jgi:hypothetical protein